MSIPLPHQPFSIDAFQQRWPMGAEKVELDSGHPYFYGAFTHKDTVTASRAFPGRPVTLDRAADAQHGPLVIHMAGCQADTCRLWELRSGKHPQDISDS